MFRKWILFLVVHSVIFAHNYYQDFSQKWSNNKDLAFKPLCIGAKDGLWLIGADKIAIYDGKNFQTFALSQRLSAPCFYVSKKNKVYIGDSKGLFVWDNDALRHEVGSPENVRFIDEDDHGRLWVVSDRTLYSRKDNKWRKFREAEADIRGIAMWGNRRGAVATDLGVWLLHHGKRNYFMELLERPLGLLSQDVRSVVIDNSGNLFIGSKKGLNLYDLRDTWIALTPQEKLPIVDVTCMELAKDGTLWIGMKKGLVRFRDGKWHYFASKRWLVNDHVVDIVCENGHVYALHNEGVSHLYSKNITLQQKSDIYQQRVIERHKRYNFVMDRNLSVRGNVTSGKVGISDNDGLWTGMYIAAQAFRYATLKDNPSAKTQAQEALSEARSALEALHFLYKITGIKGFPARAVRHKSEPEYGVAHRDWRKPENPEWEWKGDTSSDEISGHYFALYTAYKFLPDEKDKEKAKLIAKELTDHILDNNYTIVDVDGLPTTWGVWNPENINHREMWSWERGLNSLQMLAFLKMAHYIVGDPRYEKEYKKLIERHAYAMNTINQKIVQPYQVFHDTQLAYLSYYPLLQLEKNNDLRRIYLMSLNRTFRYVEKERCPVWNFMTHLFSAKSSAVAEGITTLEEIPIDLIDWSVDHRHRRDIAKQPKNKWQQDDLAQLPLSYRERYIRRWDGNPYRLTGGSRGMREREPTFFLFPYWLGKYHKLIAD
ncbi:hypothetical protein [Candidatus Uabimicrobium amorphum]|nr:hypothetical protein [Candidatus Uabimicrobium amorphum]